MSDDIIGPALPPSFRRSNDNSDEEETLVGPALPPGYKPRERSSSSEDSDEEVIVFKRARSNTEKDACGNGPTSNKLRRLEEHGERLVPAEDDDGFFGPALPPGYQKRPSSPESHPVLGPALPPGFRRPVDDEDEDDGDGEGVSGPALPPGYRAEASSSDEGEEDDDVIGPRPAKGDVQSSVAQDFERRAQKMKEKLTGDDGPEQLSRETWMTELPPELQHIGLGARTFKKRSGPENKDRSIWTDTPADRERKARERLEGKKNDKDQEAATPCISQKDLQMAEKVSKYNEQKRGESLVSMHTKKMKQAESEGRGKPAERRPFDRDMDLQVNRFDEAQKRSLLKKSQELNTRFSHSKDRMFL